MKTNYRTATAIAEKPVNRLTRTEVPSNDAFSELELTIESIRLRAESSSETLEKILHDSVLPPRWGINE